MEVFDFAASEDHDLVFKDGDIALASSAEQHQRDLLLAVPGDIRQYPLIGVGIRMELLNDIAPDELRIAIQREMERDGMVVKTLTFIGENLNLNAEYADA